MFCLFYGLAQFNNFKAWVAKMGFESPRYGKWKTAIRTGSHPLTPSKECAALKTALPVSLIRE